MKQKYTHYKRQRIMDYSRQESTIQLSRKGNLNPPADTYSQQTRSYSLQGGGEINLHRRENNSLIISRRDEVIGTTSRNPSAGTYFDIPDNSDLMRLFEQNHPTILKFLRKWGSR